MKTTAKEQGYKVVDEFGNDISSIVTVEVETEKAQTPQERTRARVYATGNKWAIENFNATH